MAATAITLGIRFILNAAICLATVGVWLNNAKGWKILEVLAVSIIFGIAATLSWACAVTIGASIANPRLRLVACPVAMVLLFVFLVFVVIGALMGMHREVTEHAVSFAILIVVIAATDAYASVVLNRWMSRRTQGAR
jgi:hypothetical protein